MAKLISQIQNYPLSKGSVAEDNLLLLSNSFGIKDRSIEGELNFLLEISKDITFFDHMGVNNSTWNDLLTQSSIFKFAKFLSLDVGGLKELITDLAQLNHFNSDMFLSAKEYEIMYYQRLQIIQFLFLFYKSFTDINEAKSDFEILEIINNERLKSIFINFEQLSKEYFILFEDNKYQAPPYNETEFEPLDQKSLQDLKIIYNNENETIPALLDTYVTINEKLKGANLISVSIFENLFELHNSFRNYISIKFSEELKIKSDHSPHNSLLLAFCQLKQLYNQRYNRLIERHTHFMYNDVLGLTRQTERADKALLSVELSKNINEHYIAKGSFFKAGKNSDNKNLFYESTHDLVANGAKIERIKSTVREVDHNSVIKVFASLNASGVEWQRAGAWMPYNDQGEAWTGIGFHSSLISRLEIVDSEIEIEFTFNKNLPVPASLVQQFSFSIMLGEDIEEYLILKTVVINEKKLKIRAVAEKK